SADAGARVTLEGLAGKKFAITPGWPLTLLAWSHSVFAPLLRWSFDRTARRARKS
ncbi:MAG: short-chain dehydrogenase, partial [Burkholderiales bacterium PBB5]